MMPKVNDLQDRNEHFENALTVSDPKMERKINDCIDKKLMNRFFNFKKNNIGKLI